MAMDSVEAPISILIVDDHPTFRFGLRKLLETEAGFEVAGEAADASGALRLAGAMKLDVVLLDMALRNGSGLEILPELSARADGARTVILTAAIENADIVRALRLGAHGILLKEASTELIVKCIREVARGQYWLGRDHVTDVIQLLNRFLPSASRAGPPPNFGLTPRELEIVAAIVSGYSNREIALKFSLSEQTVKHHVTHIYDKLGVSTRMELTLFSVSHHLIDEF